MNLIYIQLPDGRFLDAYDGNRYLWTENYRDAWRMNRRGIEYRLPLVQKQHPGAKAVRLKFVPVKF